VIVAQLAPDLTLSKAGEITIAVFTVAMGWILALSMAWFAARRLVTRTRLSGLGLYLSAAAGPAGLTVLIDAVAVATPGLPWWRLPLDVLMMAICCGTGTALRRVGRRLR
jgi:hypothetical protein